jgi:signal transduction histidine kinase
LASEPSSERRFHVASSTRDEVSALRFLLYMLLPRRRGAKTVGEQDPVRYRRIWWNVVGLTLLVSLTPLVVMTELNHFMYRRALTSESRYDIAQVISSVSRSLEFVVEERVAALGLLLEEKDVDSLSDSAGLAVTLRNLKQSFGGFVDLGLIGPNGVQEHYTGPYDLQGIRYQEEEWFQEVAARGVYVSDVFMGHRQLPHFVIAVRKDLDDGSFFVVRATVDMDLLTNLVFVPDLGPSGDVFVVSKDGVLQTPSRRHGNLLEPATVPVPTLAPETEVIENHEEQGTSFVIGYRSIAKTPFVLVVLKSTVIGSGPWKRTRAELLAILIIGTILITLVVLWSSTYMVRRIRAADLRRLDMLHRMEFTAKMATIGRLAASVAHEINNPLAIINEKAGLLRDLVFQTENHPHRDKTLNCLDGITQSVDRCGRVTHRLLGFTRRMETEGEPIDLAELLQDVLGFTGKEATHRNITITTRFADNTPSVFGDRGPLQQVFLNIINNAFAAVADGGSIELTVESPRPGWVVASVRDNGEGIPEDQLPLVFEPFFSTKGKFGTGLGLSITYDLVQRMGGRIDIRSKLGEGTNVGVELPVAAKPGSQP